MPASTTLLGALTALALHAPPVAPSAHPVPWVQGAVRDARRALGATVCLGGLEAAGCRHRLLALLDRLADFDALAGAVLRGLDAPVDAAERRRFRDALRARLVRTWERRLTGSAALDLEVVAATPLSATLRLVRGGDDVEVTLWLGATPAGPRITNVGVDGADVVHTWRPRIARLLREEGWPEVLASLERP